MLNNKEEVLKQVQKAIRVLRQKYEVPDPHIKLRDRSTLRNPTRYSSTNNKAVATRYLLAQHLVKFNKPLLNHITDDNGKRLSVDALLTGKDEKTIWQQAMSNELGRLAQGNDRGIKATDTIDFIHKEEVPITAKVAYANFVCTHRPLKSEPNRIRLVVGGDSLTCDDDTSSPAASLLETKLMLNSVISDAKQGARFMSLDLKDFFSQPL